MTKTKDYENKTNDKTTDKYKEKEKEDNEITTDSILHLCFLLALETLLASGVLLSAPFYWYLLCDADYRQGWYDLFNYSGEQTIWQIEVSRWLFFAWHILLQVIYSLRISLIVPKIVSKLTKWSAKHFPANLDPFKSVAMQRTTEIFSSCSGHFFNSITTISLYILTIHLFYREEKDRTWQFFLEKAVLLTTIGMGAVLIEKILLHLLEIEFNRNLYQDRVYKSMYNQWALNSLKSFLNHNQKAQFTRKIFPHRNSDDLIAAFLLENAALNKSSPIKKDRDQFLFKEIFTHFDPNSEGYIKLSHLEIVFGDEDARKVFSILSAADSAAADWNNEENSPKNQITRDVLKKSIQLIHRERLDLAGSLTTHASIVKKLDRLMLGFVFVLIACISPVIVGKEIKEKMEILNFGFSLAPLMTSIIYIFGESIQRIADSILYIVTCHPYDVGDRVSIDGVDFFVNKIGILSTNFKRFDGFMVWIPNYLLARKALSNIRRTEMQGQRLEIHVDSSVPLERVQLLSDSVKEFIKNDTRDFAAVITSFYDFHQIKNQLVIVFLLKHRFNFQDGVQRAERLKRFLLFLKQQVDKMGIEYRPPVFRTFLKTDEQIKNHLTNILDTKGANPNYQTDL